MFQNDLFLQLIVALLAKKEDFLGRKLAAEKLYTLCQHAPYILYTNIIVKAASSKLYMYLGINSNKASLLCGIGLGYGSIDTASRPRI